MESLFLDECRSVRKRFSLWQEFVRCRLRDEKFCSMLNTVVLKRKVEAMCDLVAGVKAKAMISDAIRRVQRFALRGAFRRIADASLERSRI